MARILVVEDELQLRCDLADYLGLAGHEVEAAGSISDCRALLARAAALDLVILDVGLPDGSGFDLAAELRQSHRFGIIMLTALGQSEDRIRGFDAGADIYLVKHSSLREIEAAVRSLLRRSEASEPQTTGALAPYWHLDLRQWLLTPPSGKSIGLTASEFAFLRLLMETGETCARAQIIEAMIRPKTSFDSRHLDSIVNRLRRKIEDISGLPAPIRGVYGVGYLFSEHARIA